MSMQEIKLEIDAMLNRLSTAQVNVARANDLIALLGTQQPVSTFTLEMAGLRLEGVKLSRTKALEVMNAIRDDEVARVANLTAKLDTIRTALGLA